jgi:hypothetical protein
MIRARHAFLKGNRHDLVSLFTGAFEFSQCNPSTADCKFFCFQLRKKLRNWLAAWGRFLSSHS